MKDVIGKAILDYQTNNAPENIITETSISEADVMETSYFFRDFAQMPPLEQTALQMVKGKILDVGCGAGSHSLYLQQQNFDVTSIDISPNAIKTCQLRGLRKAQIANVMEFGGTYDTILLLMNGTGICGSLENVIPFLKKLKSILNSNGQILIDSSDLTYMFDEDEIQQKHHESAYYGQLSFTVSYKNEVENTFDWLYLDFNTLQHQAKSAGLACELVFAGESNEYLARLF